MRTSGERAQSLADALGIPFDRLWLPATIADKKKHVA